MAFNGYLTNREIDELTKAALESGLLAVPRQTLLAGIPPGFANALPLAANPLDQFILDLVGVNRVQRMAGGEVPVLIFLENAAARLRLQDRAEARVFERILSRAGNVAAGVPPLPEPTQLPEVVNHERIIGTDDMVSVGFLADGLKVALAVALISVPRYEQGQQVTVGGGPWVAKGTTWLIAPDFAITNHHVINARLDSEADASQADLGLQAENAALSFDFDTPEADGVPVKAKRLVAVSKSLDYALLELVSPVDRPVPRLAPSIVKLDNTSRMVVNIVQHPRGRAQAGRVPEQPGECRRQDNHPLLRRHRPGLIRITRLQRPVAGSRAPSRCPTRQRRPIPGQGRGLRKLRKPDPGRPRRYPHQQPGCSRRDRRCAIRLSVVRSSPVAAPNIGPPIHHGSSNVGYRRDFPVRNRPAGR